MKKSKRIIALLVTVLTLASCEVEFSPNDRWSNIPVVYCLLDQDADTTYVRVQRCFMGEGNQYHYAANPDSINYPEGALTVLIEEWNTWVDNSGNFHPYGETPRKTYNFQYAEIDGKDTGFFATSRHPVYWCQTGGQFDTNSIFRLKIVDNATGDTIAKGETRLIYGNLRLSSPNNVTHFQFTGTAGSKTCDIRWSTITNARQYQPMVRFFYRDFIVDRSSIPYDTTITNHYIDIPCNRVKSNMRDPYCSTILEQNTFLGEIKKQLEGDTCNKNVIDTVHVYIHCCTEDLAAYIYSSHPGGSLNQEPFTYTNMEGGLGIFAARRTHIYFPIKTPLNSQSDYIRALKELGVGF